MDEDPGITGSRKGVQTLGLVVAGFWTGGPRRRNMGVDMTIQEVTPEIQLDVPDGVPGNVVQTET